MPTYLYDPLIKFTNNCDKHYKYSLDVVNDTIKTKVLHTQA